MGVRPYFGLLAVALSLTGCAGTVAPAQSALSVTDATTVPASVAAAPVRTVKITSLRTADYTKGTLTVVGTLTPAPAAGSRVALQRWSSTAGWQEIGRASCRERVCHNV